jgi:hypothetical protein
MSELLVRIVDKINPDFYLNTKCTKRGDVIVVRPDGWAWGSEELTNPQWTILRLPNVPLTEAEALLGPEKNADPSHPSHTLQRRTSHLDLDHLPANLDTLPLQTFQALKLRKQPVVDPAVFGEAHNIF